jgi:hypothetical protein
MQTHPLLVVAADLGTDAVDVFLDTMRDSDRKLWSSPSDKTGKEAIRSTFLNLISGFELAQRTSDGARAGPRADSPFDPNVPVGTRQAPTCMCGGHFRYSRVTSVSPHTPERLSASLLKLPQTSRRDHT